MEGILGFGDFAAADGDLFFRSFCLRVTFLFYVLKKTEVVFRRFIFILLVDISPLIDITQANLLDCTSFKI